MRNIATIGVTNFGAMAVDLIRETPLAPNRQAAETTNNATSRPHRT